MRYIHYYLHYSEPRREFVWRDAVVVSELIITSV
jgi:hypothetical protein